MSDSVEPKMACECPARAALEPFNRVFQARRTNEGGLRIGLLTWEDWAAAAAAWDAPCPCEGLRKDDRMRRDYVALNEQLLSRFVAAFPNYEWTGSESAIDLMAAEITTTRAERDQLRVDKEKWFHAAAKAQDERDHFQAAMSVLLKRRDSLSKQLVEELIDRQRNNAERDQLRAELAALRAKHPEARHGHE